MKHRVGVYVTVEIDIVDDCDAIIRVTENIDDWQSSYGLRTREQVLQHFAFNAIANGCEDARWLDGWADLEAGQVEIDLDRSTFEADVYS